MSLFRFLFPLLFSSFFVQDVSAVDYYWKACEYETHSTICSVRSGATPDAACNAATHSDEWSSFLSYRILNQQATTATCQMYMKTSGEIIVNSIMHRFGDSCPSGTVYNPSTGVCDATDPCESKAGQLTAHEHRIGNLDNPDAPHSEPPVSLCKDKCQVSFNYKSLDCYRYVNGNKLPAEKDLNGAYCSYEYKYNGISCTDGDTSTPDIFDQPPTKPPIDTKPSLTNATDCQEWVTNADGSRTRNCTANEKYTQPGTMNCSTSGPALTCTAGTPPPAYSDKTKTQQTTEKVNPDGSTSTSTTTTTDQTTCYGTKPCTSTSKTETETGGTKPDGTPADSSHTCTGDNCTKDDSKDDPAKDPEEGEEEEGSKVAGESCNSDLSCTGDAIQCAILRKEKEQACQWDYEKAKPGIESAIAGPEYQLQESEHDVSGLFNNASNAARWLPSSCPPPQRYSLSTGNGLSGEFSWQPTCDFASGVAPFLVAAASLFFAVYVGRGIGS